MSKALTTYSFELFENKENLLRLEVYFSPIFYLFGKSKNKISVSFDNAPDIKITNFWTSRCCCQSQKQSKFLI